MRLIWFAIGTIAGLAACGVSNLSLARWMVTMLLIRVSFDCLDQAGFPTSFLDHRR
jgi:hypothetical protein